MIGVVEFSIRKYKDNISGLKGYNKSSHHVIQNHTTYSKLTIIRPGRSRLVEFEKKIVLVV